MLKFHFLLDGSLLLVAVGGEAPNIASLRQLRLLPTGPECLASSPLPTLKVAGAPDGAEGKPPVWLLPPKGAGCCGGMP